MIAHRRVQKVFAADDFSAVGISGTAGIAIELVRLFQTGFEHYEKIEGRRLSLVGKANHLAAMVRSRLPMAFQGLVVIPIFCGFDEQEKVGRLYSYDVVGGRTRKPITPRRVRAAATPASSSAPGSGPTSPKVLRSISL